MFSTFFNFKGHSENDLVKSIKFWLMQTQNLLIIWITKCSVDPTKYLVDSIKLFDCFNRILVDSTKKFILIEQNLFG